VKNGVIKIKLELIAAPISFMLLKLRAFAIPTQNIPEKNNIAITLLGAISNVLILPNNREVIRNKGTDNV
jgi:hypothetical protein